MHTLLGAGHVLILEVAPAGTDAYTPYTSLRGARGRSEAAVPQHTLSAPRDMRALPAC